MKQIEEIARMYAKDNPDATLEQAFLAGYEAKTEQPKIDIEKRLSDFQTALSPFVTEYGREMVLEFYNYWTEKNKSGRKMRYEMEKTWDLGKRLARWANNNRNRYGNRNYKIGQGSAIFAAADSILEQGNRRY